MNFRFRMAFAIVGLALIPSLAFADSGGSANSETFTYSDSLVSPHNESYVGTHTPDGRCQFNIPPISLTPGQPTVERREVSLNKSTCVMTVEVGGKPASQASHDGGDHLYNPPSSTAAASQGVQPLGITLQAHYTVSWFDIVDAPVTETESLLQWQFDGSCVLTFAGGDYYWWQNLTGWSLYGHGENAFWSPGQGCQRVQSQITATYYNGAFCAGQDTWNYLEGIIIAGGASGQIWGWHDDTWVSEPAWCPPLHWTDDTGYGY